MDFISPLNFLLRQQELFNKHTADTGLWLFNSDEYQAWEEGRNRFLWVQGAGETQTYTA